jgi:hypothetical protein
MYVENKDSDLFGQRLCRLEAHSHNTSDQRRERRVPWRFPVACELSSKLCCVLLRSPLRSFVILIIVLSAFIKSALVILRRQCLPANSLRQTPLSPLSHSTKLSISISLPHLHISHDPLPPSH